jgi:cell division septation protein DedD
MLKNFIAGLLLFASATAFSQQLSITNNLPSSATAGVGILAEFTLTKSANMGSFAKFQLDVPVGFSVESVEIKGGNFTFENNRAKVVWVSLPAENSFVFSLKITGASSITGNVTFAPQFFYLENNVKKDYSPAPTTISYSGGSGESTSVVNTNESKNASSTTATDNYTSSSSNNATENMPSKTSSAPAETAKTTAPSSSSAAKSNVLYYVQIYALAIKPGGVSKFSEFGSVKIVEEAGFYKVLVGSFKSIDEARKRKNELLARGLQCFVVGYENGVRVKL